MLTAYALAYQAQYLGAIEHSTDKGLATNVLVSHRFDFRTLCNMSSTLHKHTVHLQTHVQVLYISYATKPCSAWYGLQGALLKRTFLTPLTPFHVPSMKATISRNRPTKSADVYNTLDGVVLVNIIGEDGSRSLHLIAWKLCFSLAS